MSQLTNPDAADFVYDELGYFGENCAEYGIDVDLPPPVARVGLDGVAATGLSGLRWGSGPIEMVLLHGGAQNAHTWDTTLLTLLARRPTMSALAIDLPGHGRSAWRDDGGYDPRTSAASVATALAGNPDHTGPVVLVGMSLGGLVAICLAAERPELVRRLVTVDITPGVNDQKAAAVHDFIAGPQAFSTFGEIFDRTVEYNPTRSAASLRRGILHNAHRLADGSWEWNYDRRHLGGRVPPAELWGDVAAVKAPYQLVRGGASPVVDDDDVAELRRHQPGVDVVVVPGAGHSVQGDAPIELAALLVGQLDH